MSTEINFENGTLTVRRVYDAPRERVFEAWVETSKVQQWWGCADCTNVRSEIEPKVGGKYNHHMTIKNAGEIPGSATLTEFDPPKRLAYTSDAPGPLGIGTMTVSVDFTEADGGTLVKLVHAGIPNMQVGPGVELSEIIKAGWTAALGKLDGFLAAAKQH